MQATSNGHRERDVNTWLPCLCEMKMGWGRPYFGNFYARQLALNHKDIPSPRTRRTLPTLKVKSCQCLTLFVLSIVALIGKKARVKKRDLRKCVFRVPFKESPFFTFFFSFSLFKEAISHLEPVEVCAVLCEQTFLFISRWVFYDCTQIDNWLHLPPRGPLTRDQ